MADNETISGSTFAFDDISGVKYQRVKLIHGADGSNDGDTDDATPLPVYTVTAAPATRTKATMTLLTKAVAASGTAVPLTATETFATYLVVTAKKVGGANTGNVYVGTSAVHKTTSQQNYLEPGDPWVLTAPEGQKIDLNEVYIDADNNDDGITGWYLPAP